MKLFCMNLLCLFFISGCAGGTYKQVEGDKTAKLRYLNKSKASVHVFIYDNNKCENPAHVGLLGNAKYLWGDDVVRRGMPLAGTENVKPTFLEEVIIEAGKPNVSYLQNFGFSQMVCSFTVSFIPEEKGLYEMIYSEGVTKCFLQLYKLVRNSSGEYMRVSVPSFRNDIQQCRH